jgi:hypothetical protein
MPPAPKAGSRCRGAAPIRTRCSPSGHTGPGRPERGGRLSWPAAPSRTAVRYVTADLLHLPAAWRRAFDLTVEIITLQALPPELHPPAAAAVRELVAGGGTLLVIGALPGESGVSPPWALTRAEIEGLASGGLETVAIETVAMPGKPAERRWRAEYRRR